MHIFVECNLIHCHWIWIQYWWTNYTKFWICLTKHSPNLWDFCHSNSIKLSSMENWSNGFQTVVSKLASLMYPPIVWEFDPHSSQSSSFECNQNAIFSGKVALLNTLKFSGGVLRDLSIGQYSMESGCTICRQPLEIALLNASQSWRGSWNTSNSIK